MARELLFRTTVPIGIFCLAWLAYLQARSLLQGDIKIWTDGGLIATLSAAALAASIAANRLRVGRSSTA
jgi:hypothetical protein